MECAPVIAKLQNERARLDEIIGSLEQLREELRPFLKKKRGRKFLTEAERQEVSARMRKYWADWRQRKNR